MTVAGVRNAPLKPKSISPEYPPEPCPISLFPSQACPQGRGSNPPPAPPSFSLPETSGPLSHNALHLVPAFN